MENLDDGRIHHKTIPVKFNGVITPEEGTEKMDIAINNYLNELQKKYPDKKLEIFGENTIERRFTEKSNSCLCLFITFFFKLI